MSLRTLVLGTSNGQAYDCLGSCSTAIGVKVKDGIILAVEKIVQSKLLVPGANKRIATIDTHAGLVSQGTTSCIQYMIANHTNVNPGCNRSRSRWSTFGESCERRGRELQGHLPRANT